MAKRTYADGEVIYGEGTLFRVRVLPAGTRARPADLGAADEVRGVTTSTLTGNQTETTAPIDYDTESGGWADGHSGQKSWTFPATIQVKKIAGQATLLDALWDAWADGREVWVERLRPEDGFWRGGVAAITSPSEPVTSDGAVTMPLTFTGRGALVKTEA